MCLGRCFDVVHVDMGEGVRLVELHRPSHPVPARLQADVGRNARGDAVIAHGAHLDGRAGVDEAVEGVLRQ